MSLRDRLAQRRGEQADDSPDRLYKAFGVRRNPFPSAGQPGGHPHMVMGEADNEIERRILTFERDHSSQAIVIEGTQGVGKTNLLNYYQQELEELYRGQTGAYIIRYYPDPEPSFDGVLRKIIEELGEEHFVALGRGLASLGPEKQAERLTASVRNAEVRNALSTLADASEPERVSRATAIIEWLVGLRVLKRHTDLLRVKFRLDTVESKTQALRDIVDCSIEIKLLKGIFLLLDELEKQDMTLSKTTVLRYLLAIRALIDALPKNFFLMVAITTEAKRRYFGMVPALQGRLAASVVLKPLATPDEARALYDFYLGRARQEASTGTGTTALPEAQHLLPLAAVQRKFEELAELAARRGAQGVSHREFLNAMHDMTETAFEGVAAA